MDAPVASLIPTGFAALDVLLGGGWPTGVLTELLVPHPGGAELGLLCPALARLSGDAARGWVMLIAPPRLPYAPGLRGQGLVLERLVLVRVRQAPEALWALDETLRAGACAGVIAWAGTAAFPRHARPLLQRLHLLAGRQTCWAVLVRAARCRPERSPARLRLELRTPAPDRLQVEVFRNGWRGAGAVTLERCFPE